MRMNRDDHRDQRTSYSKSMEFDFEHRQRRNIHHAIDKTTNENIQEDDRVL